MTEKSEIPAFDHFTIKVNLMQQAVPPCLYFTAVLIDVPRFFPSSAYMNGVYHRGVPSTLFKLDTQDGYLKTPPMKTPAMENETIIATFQLSILLENLSFSISPFEKFSPVDIKQGKLYFPVQPSHIGQIPQVQTQLYHHVAPRYNVPPPPMDPPRLFRRSQQNPDDSVHWNTTFQTYVSEN